jgi:hypothetical protein
MFKINLIILCSFMLMHCGIINLFHNVDALWNNKFIGKLIMMRL